MKCKIYIKKYLQIHPTKIFGLKVSSDILRRLTSYLSNPNLSNYLLTTSTYNNIFISILFYYLF